MNARRLNLVMWMGALALSAAAIFVLVRGAVMPLDTGPLPNAAAQQGRTPAQSVAATSSAATPAPPVDLARIGSLRLRRTLAQAPAEQEVSNPSPPPIAPSALPSLTLVGTIGDSLAMLQTPGGAVELKGVGETIAGTTVVSIRPARVELQFNGRTVVLVKPVEPPAGASIHASGEWPNREEHAPGDAGPTARTR